MGEPIRIDLESHFYTMEYIDTLRRNKGFPRIEGAQDNGIQLKYFEDVTQVVRGLLLNKLLDVEKERLMDMDKAGVTIQVLSLSAPGVECLDPSIGVPLARKINDELSNAIEKNPDRFIGSAALAVQDPGAAADELERCIKDLGFKMWKTHSNFGDTYLDDKRYWPILEKAERLGVPIYLHPTVPKIAEVRSYGFALAGPSFGFGFETGLCLMRMIYAGVFDKYPNLKIILGHLGEALPFLLTRIDYAYVKLRFILTDMPKISKKPSDYLKSNVYVTTSGMCFKPAFMCTYHALGIDKIAFATDYPYEEMSEIIQFLDNLPISEEDKQKIYYLNPKRSLSF